MNLFEGEKIITTTDSNIVILTTHRIRSNNSIQWGHHSTVSIMLEKISSIQAIYSSYPILLVLAGLLILGAAFASSQPNSVPAILLLVGLAIILIIGYFTTKKHVCVIASDGGAKLVFETTRMSKDGLLKFIDQVEQAKYSRIKESKGILF